MNSNALSVFLLLFLLFCSINTTLSVEITEDDGLERSGWIELNPEYMEPDDQKQKKKEKKHKKQVQIPVGNEKEDAEDEYDECDEDEEYECYEDEEEDDDDDDGEEEEDIKAMISSYLKKSKDVIQSNNTTRAVSEFVKKNRVPISVAAVAFVFRQQLWGLASKLISEPIIDPITGKRVGRRLNFQGMIQLLFLIEGIQRLNEMTGGFEGIQGLNKMTGGFLPPTVQHYTFERINDRYEKDHLAFLKAMGYTHVQKTKAKNTKTKYNSTTIILELSPGMAGLKDQVSFLLQQHRIIRKSLQNVANNSTLPSNNTVLPTTVAADILQPQLEVILLVESPGGEASGFGLAAEQIGRLRREPGITVTVCVDKVAASGGYMMACMASPGKLFAAPFALVGSIGVVGQQLNIQNTLEKYGVRPIVFRGGRDKAPVGLIGDVTKEGIATVQSMVDDIHRAFKNHVLAARPNLQAHLEEVTTGQVWLGRDAMKLGLVDRIVTSDEYIGERLQDGARILKLFPYQPGFFFGSRSGLRGINAIKNANEGIMNFFREVRLAASKISFLVDQIQENKGIQLSSRLVDAVNLQPSASKMP